MKTLIGALCGVAIVLGARASVNDSAGVANSPGNESSSPYSAIWLRNVFELKPTPPPAVAEVAKPVDPPPNVQLTGITTLFGNVRAYFLVQKQEKGKPPGKEESYRLSAGQRQGNLEVMDINPKTRMVKIKVDDVESTITFSTNKTASAQNVASGGPRPGGGGPPPGMPGVNPGGKTGGLPMPNRPTRGNDFNPQAPTANNFSQPGFQQQAYGGQSSQQPALTPDVQAVLMMANAQAHADEIAAGTYPPIPMSADMKAAMGSGPSSAPETTGSSSSPAAPQIPSSLQPRGNYNPYSANAPGTAPSFTPPAPPSLPQ